MNILPGMGLGFSGSKEIAFGLAPILVYTPEVPDIPSPVTESHGAGRGGGSWASAVTVYDNAYSRGADVDEILMLLTHIHQVIE